MDPDKKYIYKCFELAKLGKGHVSPNPLVGSVIVKNGQIISSGWHAQAGKSHAEAVAIARAGQDLNDSTLYCNLEPCSHTNKKTAPCTPMIIKSGIKKVIFSNIDPNPQVAGKSVDILRKAGIEVKYSVLEEEGAELNRFFFKYIQQKIPWIHLKMAQSLDGKISISRNTQTWLTGDASAEYVHSLRAEHDAVLVGAGTIAADNPLLNVRHVEGRDPLKIIIDGRLNLSAQSKIFKDASPGKTWIFYNAKHGQTDKINMLKQNATLIALTPSKNGLINLNDVLQYCGTNNIISILVEGGQSIFSQFFESNLFDEITVLQSPKILGNGLDSLLIKKQISLKLHNTFRLDNDYGINFRKDLI